MNGKEFKKHPYYKKPTKGVTIIVTNKPLNPLSHELTFDGKNWHHSRYPEIEVSQSKHGPGWVIYDDDTIEIVEPT